MANTVSDLLLSNLDPVFGKGVPPMRRAAIDVLLTDDAILYAPDGFYRGRAAIDRVAGRIRPMHPDFSYTVTGPPEVFHDTADRVSWVSGRRGKPPSYARTGFIIAQIGRIAAVYLFFDRLPTSS